MKHHGYNLKVFVRRGGAGLDLLARAFKVTKQSIALYYGKEEFDKEDIDSLKNAGINKKITYHCARHTFGSIMVNELNVDIVVVKELFGHADLKTTMRYLQLKNGKKVEATDRLAGLFK